MPTRVPVRDLGGMAEKHVADWAHHVNITPNKSTEDREGWDYFLQFPHPAVETDTPLDRRKSRIECLVQVKGTTEKQVSKSIKLSNWAKLVESPFPAFFLIVVYSDSFDPVAAYLVHVGEESINRLLERLRQLRGVDEETLNRRRMVVRWNYSDTLTSLDGPGLHKAIESHIPDGIDSYKSWKSETRVNAGDPNPTLGRWTKSFESNDIAWQEIVDFAIGIQDSISVPEMILEEDVRFGIPGKSTIFGEGTIEITTRSGIECVLDFHDLNQSTNAVFEARLFNTRMVLGDIEIPSQFNKWRIIFDLGELIVEMGSGKGKLSLNFPTLDKQFKFDDLFNAWKLAEVFSRDDNIQVSISVSDDTTEHQIVAQLHLDDETFKIDELLQYWEVVDKTRRMLHALELSLDFHVSVVHLLNNQGTTDNILSVVDPREDIASITVLHDSDAVDTILQDELVIPLFFILNHDDQKILLKIAISGFPELTGITAPGQKEFRLTRTRILRFEQEAYASDTEFDFESALTEYQDSFDAEGYNVLLLPRSPQEN